MTNLTKAESAQLQAENRALKEAAKDVIHVLITMQDAWDTLGAENHGTPRQEIFENNGTICFGARMKLTRAMKGEPADAKP